MVVYIYLMCTMYVYTNMNRDIIVPNNFSRMCRRGFDLLFSGRTRLLYTHSVRWLLPYNCPNGPQINARRARAPNKRIPRESLYVVARSSSTVVLPLYPSPGQKQDNFYFTLYNFLYIYINNQNMEKVIFLIVL